MSLVIIDNDDDSNNNNNDNINTGNNRNTGNDNTNTSIDFILLYDSGFAILEYFTLYLCVHDDAVSSQCHPEPSLWAAVQKGYWPRPLPN